MTTSSQGYLHMNQGKPMQKYKITKMNAKHGRHELIDGKDQFVLYGYPDPHSPHQDIIVNEIVMTDLDARKYQKVLGLIPLTGTRSGEGAVAKERREVVPVVHIPADWATLAVAERCSLATAIKGEEIKRVKTADKIIEEYLHAGKSDSE